MVASETGIDSLLYIRLGSILNRHRMVDTHAFGFRV